MDDQECPRCKTTKYRKPTLKLMVNICGHPLCESCVDLLFLKGIGNCYECNLPLRRGNFRIQQFDDNKVEKEVEIRKRLLKDYNKSEEDFETLDEYNNYLEELEEIVFNLCNDIDYLETTKRIDNYKRINKDVIMRNKVRQSKAERELNMIIEEEKERDSIKRNQLYMIELETKKRKIHNKEALIDELTYSTGGASDIVNVYATRMNEDESNIDLTTLTDVKKPIEVPKHFSSGILIGQNSSLLTSSTAIVKQELGPLYIYEVPIKIIEGPEYPTWNDLLTKGYLKHIRSETIDEKAGGYVCQIACMRALQDAYAGLFNVTEKRNIKTESEPDETEVVE